MKSFKQHLEEQTRGKGLTVFDIDETLFQTQALIHVKKDGKTIRKLTNQEYNEYKLQPGEEFDYGEFRNAKVFAETSIPIWSMIKKQEQSFRMLSRQVLKLSSLLLVLTLMTRKHS